MGFCPRNLGYQAIRLSSGGEMSDDFLGDERLALGIRIAVKRLALGIRIAVSSKEEWLPCGGPLLKVGRKGLKNNYVSQEVGDW